MPPQNLNFKITNFKASTMIRGKVVFYSLSFNFLRTILRVYTF